MKFLTVSLNPTFQKTLFLDKPFVRNEINRLDQHRFDISGKGVNVARVLKQLGCDVAHLTHLGHQSTLFLKMAAEGGIPVIWENSSSEIRYCYTLLDRQEKGVVEGVSEIIEEASPVSQNMGDLILTLYKSILRDFTHLVISGSKAPGYDDKIYGEMVKTAKEYGLKVLLDIRGADLMSSLEYKPQYLKINLLEFLSTFFPELRGDDKEKGFSAEDWEKVRGKMLSLKKDYDITTILTDESNPVLYVDGDKIRKLTPPPANVLNTTGCGDAFAAGVIQAVAQRSPLKAIISAGLECAKKNAELMAPGVIE